MEDPFVVLLEEKDHDPEIFGPLYGLNQTSDFIKAYEEGFHTEGITLRAVRLTTPLSIMWPLVEAMSKK